MYGGFLSLYFWNKVKIQYFDIRTSSTPPLMRSSFQQILTEQALVASYCSGHGPNGSSLGKQESHFKKAIL